MYSSCLAWSLRLTDVREHTTSTATNTNPRARSAESAMATVERISRASLRTRLELGLGDSQGRRRQQPEPVHGVLPPLSAVVALGRLGCVGTFALRVATAFLFWLLLLALLALLLLTRALGTLVQLRASVCPRHGNGALRRGHGASRTNEGCAGTFRGRRCFLCPVLVGFIIVGGGSHAGRILPLRERVHTSPHRVA